MLSAVRGRRHAWVGNRVHSGRNDAIQENRCEINRSLKTYLDITCKTLNNSAWQMLVGIVNPCGHLQNLSADDVNLRVLRIGEYFLCKGKN